MHKLLVNSGPFFFYINYSALCYETCKTQFKVGKSNVFTNHLSEFAMQNMGLF